MPITVHLFTTVDGVVEVPTWTFPYGSPDDLAAAVGALTADASGILLGRKTYEMFAPAWSVRTVDDDPGAPFFNDSPKYVVSNSLTNPQWAHTRSSSARASDCSPREARRPHWSCCRPTGSATAWRTWHTGPSEVR